MPVIVPVIAHPPGVSERAKRLGAELAKTIEDFRRREPQTTDFEIRQATLMASRSASGARSAQVAAIAAGAGFALVLGIALAVRGGQSGQARWAPLAPVAVVAVIAAIALTVYLRKRE
jgi:hypothetical protein